MDFVVKGMIGGFALVAAPAEYEITGVRTFVVSHDGVVYEKDLGAKTLNEFKSMQRFKTSTDRGRWSQTGKNRLIVAIHRAPALRRRMRADFAQIKRKNGKLDVASANAGRFDLRYECEGLLFTVQKALPLLASIILNASVVGSKGLLS